MFKSHFPYFSTLNIAFWLFVLDRKVLKNFKPSPSNAQSPNWVSPLHFRSSCESSCIWYPSHPSHPSHATRPTIDQLPHFPKPSSTNWTGKYKIDYGTVCVYPFEDPSCVRYWSDLISSPLHPWASCYRSMQGGTWQAWQGTREWTQHNSHYMSTTWLPSLLTTSAPLCPGYLVSLTAMCLTGWSYSVVKC